MNDFEEELDLGERRFVYTYCGRCHMTIGRIIYEKREEQLRFMFPGIKKKHLKEAWLHQEQEKMVNEHMKLHDDAERCKKMREALEGIK